MALGLAAWLLLGAPSWALQEDPSPAAEVPTEESAESGEVPESTRIKIGTPLGLDPALTAIAFKKKPALTETLISETADAGAA